MLKSHLLIAGATGSGKSVLIHDLIKEVVKANASLILLDPKKVELIDYIDYPNLLHYGDESTTMIFILKECVNIMMQRYNIMKNLKLKKTNENHIYIFIDELADLLTTNKKEVLPLLQRLAQLGRAAGIHLIVATQRPTKDILTGQLTVNLDTRIALRTANAQDSRNIIGVSGAELLPRYGYYIITGPDYLTPKLVNNLKQ